MALPKRIYTLYQEINKCSLVSERKVTDETIKQFNQLLNLVKPVDDKEIAYRELVRMMYRSNQDNFIRYICDGMSHVGALILWTEGRRIASYFGLNRVVYIGWNKETDDYTVTKFVPNKSLPEKKTFSSVKKFTRKVNARVDKKNISDMSEENKFSELAESITEEAVSDDEEEAKESTESSIKKSPVEEKCDDKCYDKCDSCKSDQKKECNCEKIVKDEIKCEREVINQAKKPARWADLVANMEEEEDE